MKMCSKTLIGPIVLGWLLVATVWPQSDSVLALPFTSPRALGSCGSYKWSPATAAGLEHVLGQMDAAAKNFRSTEARRRLGPIPEGH